MSKQKGVSMSYTAYLKNIVTNLPKTKEEEQQQKRYDIVMGILILSPIFISAILIALGYKILGVSILVLCWGLVAIIGINKGKQINKKFYKIKNAHTRFNIVNVNDANIIKELYDDPALTFFAGPDDELLDFIFNWLNNEGVLKSDSLNIYAFDGHMLKQAFSHIRWEDEARFLSIFLKDLNINDSNKVSFAKAHFVVGSRWLDDVVDNDRM